MCQFSLLFSGDAENLIKKVEQELSKAGGAFNGDAAQGNFQVKTPLGLIEGDYQIAGHQIFITITDKPFFISCERIQKELRGVMS